MAQTTFKYNPSQQSVDDLEQTFVGRQDLLEGILSELQAQEKSSSRQHYVIIGPRGIGKTNMLLMIYYALKRRPDLAQKWIPVQLAEESYSVLGLADFFLETLRAMSAEVKGIDDEIEAIAASDDDEAVVDRSLDLIRKIAKDQNKSILVLVDNLDMILQDQMRDQMEIHRLRSILMSQDFLTIIGTSPTLFNELTNYDSPLYNFFKTINLKELSAEEMETLIAKRLTLDGKPAEAEALAQYRPRLQAIRHLTGGNPRLLLMLYQICEHGEIPEVKKALETLLDELTPYFKHRIEVLAPQMRKVMDTLARSDAAMTPTEIAGEARLDVKQVNVQLTRMKDEGLVTARPVPGKRNTYYEMSERLFRIWYKMRLSRKDRNKIYFLAEFFQAWYKAEEMLALVTGLGERFQAALAEKDDGGAKRLLESVHIVEHASADSSVRFAAIAQEFSMLMQLDEPAQAADRLQEFESSVDPDTLTNLMYLLAAARAAAGQRELALRCIGKGLAALSRSQKDWLHDIFTFSAGDAGAHGESNYGILHFATAGQIVGATHRDAGFLVSLASDAETTTELWACLGWWYCAVGQFAAASFAYGIARARAEAARDAEFAGLVQASSEAARALADEVEPQDVRASWVACPPQPLSPRQSDWQEPSRDLVNRVAQMIALWQGISLVSGDTVTPSDLATERDQPTIFGLMLRSLADAVSLEKAENRDHVAARLGDERLQLAQEWAKHYSSAREYYRILAGWLSYSVSDSEEKATREVEIRLRT